MRTVFLGTSEFAVDVLRRLARSDHAPALVVTRPDRPRGRGRKLQSPPVAVAAADLGVELFQPDDLNDPFSRARIGEAEPEVLCLCAYGAIVRDPLLSDWEIFNVHPSLLPRWRGAAPVERAIMAGDDETGVSIMKLAPGLDDGPVCLADRVAIDPADDYGAVAGRLAALGGDLLVRALDERPKWREQPEEGVTYADKIEAADRVLRPAEESAAALARRVRALTPHIGARLELPGTDELLGVRRVGVLDCGPPPGHLARAGEKLLLGCATGALELLEIQPAGRRPMAAGDWLRGDPPALRR